MMAMTIRIITATGNPAISRPKISNPVLPKASLPTRLGKVAPFDVRFAAPRAMYIIPKVAMNGATVNLVIITPLIAPTIMPIIIAISTILGMEK